MITASVFLGISEWALLCFLFCGTSVFLDIKCITKHVIDFLILLAREFIINRAGWRLSQRAKVPMTDTMTLATDVTMMWKSELEVFGALSSILYRLMYISSCAKNIISFILIFWYLVTALSMSITLAVLSKAVAHFNKCPIEAANVLLCWR
jgi:hypothetical protein